MMISACRKRISMWLLAALAPIAFWSGMTLESRSLYHPDMADYPDPTMALHLNPWKIETVDFTTPDGVRLNGWYVPPKAGRPTVVFAHGNGGNIADRMPILDLFAAQGYGFFAFDYRGFGKSGGTSNEQGLYTDFAAASDYLTQTRSTPVADQIAFGESLGSAVVVDVAARRPFRGVILSPALASIPAAARNLVNHSFFGLLTLIPVESLVQQRYDALSKIDRIHSPLLIMHGDADTLTPLWMAQKLYARSTAPYKKLLIIPGAGHNEVFFRGESRLFPELERLLSESAEANRKSVVK